MKQYYYQNNYGVIASKKVCSCAPILNFFCGPQNFSIGANLYQEIAIFLRLKAHILKARTVKFGMTVRTWDSLHQAKFCKNRLRGYTPYGQMYTKNTNFGDFGGCRPTFYE